MKNVLRFCAAGMLAAVLAGLAGISMMRADDKSERRVAMHNIHTDEDISIVYKKDGQYIPEALDKLNWFMRDWRANKASKMDPHTIDMVWEIHEELGSKEPIHLISGYRAPGTNEKLRKAGGGQAQFSQHILGKAMDVTFPDISVQKLRYAGLVREGGGVGYYPTSGVPFVHIDSGTVRMWPRMPRYELALLFPKGHSRFVPQDGRPIAVGDVSYARAHFTQMADAIAAFHQFRAQPKDRTMVASLDKSAPVPNNAEVAMATAENVDETSSLPPLPEPARRPLTLASLSTAEVSPARAMPAVAKSVVAKSVVVKAPKLATASASASVSLASLTVPALVPDRSLSIAATVSARSTADDQDAMAQMRPPAPTEVSGNEAFINKAGWVSQPAYDDDHDSELSYRPFPLFGLIEQTPSVDNPVLSKLVRPDLEAAHRSIDQMDNVRMQFRQNLKLAELLWSDDFSGRDPAGDLTGRPLHGATVAGRLVQTASRQ